METPVADRPKRYHMTECTEDEAGTCWGCFPPEQIAEIADDEWKFRSAYTVLFCYLSATDGLDAFHKWRTTAWNATPGPWDPFDTVAWDTEEDHV
jgi:hypothetical protein